MLDKTKVYSGFCTPRKPGASPSANFRRVKVLFEDDISYYVESLVENDTDAAGHGIRRSVKKHCYELVEYRQRLKLYLCEHDVQKMNILLETVFAITFACRSQRADTLLKEMYDLLRQDY